MTDMTALPQVPAAHKDLPQFPQAEESEHKSFAVPYIRCMAETAQQTARKGFAVSVQGLIVYRTFRKTSFPVRR